MLQDLGIAGRRLRKNSGFTSLAVLTLALGIGATSAVFSVVNAVMLRPLTGYDTGRLVRIGLAWVDGGSGTPTPSVDTYREWLKQSSALEHIAANQFCFLNLTGLGEPEQVSGPCTTANWFEVHKAQAMIGRTFLPGEDQPGKEHVIVLEHSFWLRRFGGDRGVVGRTITLDKRNYEVIGVMPPEYEPLGKGNASFFIPYVLDHHPETGVLVTARLKPGVLLETARAEMAVISDRLARANPNEHANHKVHVTPLLEERVGPHRKLLLLLLGSVALVLLIAAANVAVLFLSRGMSRQSEFSIRWVLRVGVSFVRCWPKRF